LVVRFGPQSALNQDRRSIANITGDYIVGELWAMNVAESGIDRMRQIEARVDQRAVKIKDDEFYRVRIKHPANPNHETSG
jgi:hypothetical protein